MKKWIYITLLGLALSLQSVSADEWIEYDLELTDENGSTHTQTVILELRHGEAYFEGDIFVGYVLEDGTISETPYAQVDDGLVSPFSVAL